MSIKKTELLAAELEVISDTLTSRYCSQVLKEAAERLVETDKIAEFYRKKAEGRS